MFFGGMKLWRSCRNIYLFRFIDMDNFSSTLFQSGFDARNLLFSGIWNGTVFKKYSLRTAGGRIDVNFQIIGFRIVWKISVNAGVQFKIFDDSWGVLQEVEWCDKSKSAFGVDGQTENINEMTESGKNK